MVFNNNRSNKRSNNGRKNGQRDSHRRHRNKQRTMIRQDMIDGKISGDRFDEDIVSSGDRRTKNERHDGNGDFSVPKPHVTRSVQVGTPRDPKKFATTNSAGRVTVREDKFRKSSSTSWAAYHATLRRTMTTSQGGLTEERAKKRADQESYLLSLRDILDDYVHYDIVSVVYAGHIGQGQRKRFFKKLKYRLTSTQCIIVADGGVRPVVVFSYRYVMLDRYPLESDLNANWSKIFHAEAQHALAHTKALPSDVVLPAEHQGFGEYGPAHFMDAAHAFASKHIEGDLDSLVIQLKEYGPSILRICGDLYAFSCVVPSKRKEYLFSRAMGVVATSAHGRTMLIDVFTLLADNPDVAIFVASFLATHGAKKLYEKLNPGPEEDPVQATHEGFGLEQVGDFLSTLKDMTIAPGTVVNALVLLVAAGWTITHSKDSGGTPIKFIFSCAKSVAGVGKCETMDDAVALLLKAVPVVISAVGAAIAAKSLAPFFKKEESLFQDFVLVRSAYPLHKAGQYPNTVFVDRDSFIRALAAVRARFTDAANDRVIPKEVSMHINEVNTMYMDVVNDLSGRFREAPYALAIVGGSGIGKSVLTRLFADRVIKADGGKPLSSDDIYTQQPTDKFASGYNMSKRVVVLDDLCNQKATQGASLASIPTAIVIDTINNVMTPTNQADLSSKGKIFWNPRMVVATSNVLKLGANLYSNEPVSILRRFNWFIEPTVRPRYRVPGGTGLNPQCDYPDLVNDVWTFQVYRWIPSSGSDKMKKVFCRALGRTPDIFDLIAFLERDSVSYYAAQKSLSRTMDAQEHINYPVDELRNMSGRANAVRRPVAGEQQGFPIFGDNPLEDSDDGYVEEKADEPPSDDPAVCGDDASPEEEEEEYFPGVPFYESPVAQDREVDGRDYGSLNAYHEARAAASLAAQQDAHRARIRREQFVADVQWFFEPFVRWLRALVAAARPHVDSMFAIHFFMLVCVWIHPWCIVPSAAHLYSWYRFGVATKRTARRVAVSATAVASSVAFIAWIALRDKGKKPKQEPFPAGERFPCKAHGVVEYTMNTKDNVVPGGPPVAEAPATSTMENLAISVSRNLAFGVMSAGTSVSIAVLTPLKTNFYVGNYHTFKPILAAAKEAGEFRIVLTRRKGQPQTHTVPYSCLWFPGYEQSDLVFMRLHGPPEVDLTRYVLPHSWLFAMGRGQTMPIRDSALHILRAPFDCKKNLTDPRGQLSMIRAQTYSSPQLITCMFDGAPGPLKMIGTHSAKKTERGDCGSPYFVKTEQGSTGGSYFAGILAGRVARRGETYALAMAPITDLIVETAIAKLTGVEHQSARPLFGFNAEMRLSAQRTHVELPTDVPGTVPLGVITNAVGTNVASKNTFHSRLKKSPFCDLPVVSEIFGPIAHKTPPDPKSYEHFSRVVRRMERIVVPVSPAEILAVEDLKSQLCGVVAWSEPPSGGVRPLTLYEAINGKDDIKAYPMDTSPGFGFKGKKLSFFTEACVRGGCADPDCVLYHPTDEDAEVPGRQVNYYPGPELLAQIEDLRERLLAGEIDLAIFRAALKDEPVSSSKEKIRVFFVGMMSWNILIRQFYAPFLSVMKKDRFGSECAVGMDCLSKDWHNMMEHLDAYNENYRLAGDYSNYDNSIHGRLIGHAYDIIHCLATQQGWDERILRQMSGIGMNMTSPVYILLGAVYRVNGTNPSGVAITTWINSIVNSLVHRIAFYTLNPGFASEDGSVVVPNFKDHVRLITYGDDVLGAFRDGDITVAPMNNHHVRAAAMTFGMKFGPIDKESGEFPTYYARGHVTFLKCEDVFLPSLERHVGMISNDSVRKCLTFERNSDFEARRNTAESALRLFYVRAAVEEAEDDFDRLRLGLLGALSGDECISVESENMLPTFDMITRGYMDAEKTTESWEPEVWWQSDF